MPPRSRSSPPPPPPSSRPSHRPRHHGADVSLDPAAIDRALAPIIPDPRERAFVLRCVLQEGPRHHRVASWALLGLLAAVVDELGGVDPRTAEGATEPLRMRLPPHVAATSEDSEFPVRLPTRALREVLGVKDADLALECLRDGPPHHALANTLMTWLLEAIYERVRDASATRRGRDA